jgi:hypothetical protein
MRRSLCDPHTDERDTAERDGSGHHRWNRTAIRRLRTGRACGCCRPGAGPGRRSRAVRSPPRHRPSSQVSEADVNRAAAGLVLAAGAADNRRLGRVGAHSVIDTRDQLTAALVEALARDYGVGMGAGA